MRALLTLVIALAIGSAHAEDEPCTFFVSTAATFGGWHIVEGRAEVKVVGARFTAQLFGDPSDSAPTHTLEGAIKAGRVTATLVNRYSDAGSDKVVGLYVKAIDPDGGTPQKIFESFVAHNGAAAVGVKCYGRKPGLTSHSTGPARKAAQAGEFKRWASY